MLQLENEQSIFLFLDKVTLLSTLKLSVIQKLSHKSNETEDSGIQATEKPNVKGAPIWFCLPHLKTLSYY